MKKLLRITRLSKKIASCWLSVLFATVISSFSLATSTTPVLANDNPVGTDIRIEPRGSGWDIYVKYHVKSVTISSVKFSGTIGSATASYPQPYVVGYNFEINNELCGGDFDPVTGTYQYPNEGQATIAIFFPSGTYADPDLPGITETTVIRRSPCGDDGPVKLVPQPIIEIEDVTDIAGSIWERIDLPVLQIKANPGVGVVTVPAWFWLIVQQTQSWWPGTDPNVGGQPFGVTVTIPLPGQTHTVQVLVDVTKVLWDFGDSNNSKRFMLTTFVGKQYPKKSNVTHAYNNEWTYHPQTTITFVPRYSWNGGAWTELPDLFRETLTLGELRVREAQTVLIEPNPSNPNNQ